MMRVNFENLPFGDTDEIVQYTVVMAEKSGGSNFKADNAVNSQSSLKNFIYFFRTKSFK